MFLAELFLNVQISKQMQLTKEDENEITRYTLYGYIGTKLQNMDIKERQKKSYAKLSFLTYKQFKYLVEDVKSEINRRVFGSEIADISNQKLASLPESKFLDLVIDVFFVFNKRVPSKNFDSTEQPVSDLLANFEKFIFTLKNYEKFPKKTLERNGTVFYKISQYQDFMKKELQSMNKSTDIIDYMNALFECKEFFLLEILLNPETLIEIGESLLKNNVYFNHMKEKLYALEGEQDIQVRNRTTLDFMEILLYKNSYNTEIDETINLLENYKISESDFEQKIKKLIKGIKKHAERIRDQEKIDNLRHFKYDMKTKRNDQKILHLANMLKEIIIQDRQYKNRDI